MGINRIGCVKEGEDGSIWWQRKFPTTRGDSAREGARLVVPGRPPEITLLVLTELLEREREREG